MTLGGHFTYFITVFLMIAGLYIVIARGNLIKKLVGLGIFQTSVYLLYIAPGKLVGGTAPILQRRVHRLLQSAAARADPHRHRRRRGDARARPGAGGAHPRGLRHHRGRRDPGIGRGSEPSDHRTHESGAHLPALQVVVPLLAAPLTVLLRRRDVAFGGRVGGELGRARDRRCCCGCRSAAAARSPTRSATGRRRGASSTASTRSTPSCWCWSSGIAAVVLPYSRASIDAEVSPAAALPLLHDVRCCAWPACSA